MLSASPVLKSPLDYFEQRRTTLSLLENRLVSTQKNIIQRCNDQFLTNAAKLDALSPLKVLTRGYALTQTEDGTVIRSVKQLKTGDNIHIQVSDGSVSASVTQIEENVYGSK